MITSVFSIAMFLPMTAIRRALPNAETPEISVESADPKQIRAWEKKGRPVQVG
jgi:hypothetical protein